MALWNKTGNQIIERRNDFLKDLAHGQDVIYRVTQMTGGTFDPVTDRIVGGSTQPLDTTFVKGGLFVPMKALDDGGSDGMVRSRLTVAGGHRIAGMDITQELVLRMHTRIPLNFEATYVIAGQTYKLSRILASIAVGAQPFWNDVILSRA
jgi:hypothetical protein